MASFEDHDAPEPLAVEHVKNLKLLWSGPEWHDFAVTRSDRVEVTDAPNRIAEPLKLLRIQCRLHARCARLGHDPPKKSGKGVPRLKRNLGRLVPAAVLRQKLGGAEFVWRFPFASYPLGIGFLINLAELVMGIDVGGLRLHRADQVAAILLLAHVALRSVLGPDFGNSFLHAMFCHVLVAVIVSVGSLAAYPSVSLALRDATGDILSEFFIANAFEFWHGKLLLDRALLRLRDDRGLGRTVGGWGFREGFGWIRLWHSATMALRVVNFKNGNALRRALAA